MRSTNRRRMARNGTRLACSSSRIGGEYGSLGGAFFGIPTLGKAREFRDHGGVEAGEEAGVEAH